MATEKISQMPFAVSINGAEFLPIVQGGINKRVLLSQVGVLGNRFVVTGFFTLTANATTTTVLIPSLVGGTSYLAGVPTPQSVHAAASIASTWYVISNGQFVATHANNTQTDRTFSYAIVV